MKENILLLRQQGLSYESIAKAIPCAVSTVWYYCTEGAKAKRNGYKSRDKKEQVIRLKREAGGKCSLCPYDKCLAALDFHHINPQTKKGDVTSLLRTSYRRAKEEAAKCILICANCHREIHAGVRTLH